MIVSRAEEIGLDWNSMIEELKSFDGWDTLLKSVTNADVEYPEYYQQPFHAYEKVRLEHILSS